MQINTWFIAMAILLALSCIGYSCAKKKMNDTLFEESKAVDLSFYKGKDTLYSPKGGSPHGNFKLKFNAIALTSLGADGKLPSGSIFAEGSLIVKEIYSENKLSLYVSMKKDSKSKYAAKNWVWAEYKPNGFAYYNVSKKGKGCVSCHSSSDTRDYTRSFDLH
jgi:hypothetical protein